jgi:hypothetical protein
MTGGLQTPQVNDRPVFRRARSETARNTGVAVDTTYLISTLCLSWSTNFRTKASRRFRYSRSDQLKFWASPTERNKLA